MKKRYFSFIIIFFFFNAINAQQSKVSHVVLFNSGKFEITEAEKARLDSLLGVIKRWTNYKLSLYGHTDDVGSDEVNEKLSQNRVKAVYTYLMNHQYDTSKMATKSFGEKNPVADNNDSVKKSLNRSVEMVMQRYDAKRVLKLNDGIEVTLPEKTFGTMFNDDIEFQTVTASTMEQLAKTNFTTLDEKGNPLATIGMVSLKPFNIKNKEVSKDRKLAYNVVMSSKNVNDTFFVYTGQLLKDKIVWTKNAAKVEKSVVKGIYIYSYTVPAGYDYFSCSRPYSFGSDLCMCNDPFIANNIQKENGVGLYDKSTFRSDRGIVVTTDSNDIPSISIVDAKTTESKMMIKAFENIGNKYVKDCEIFEIKSKDGNGFIGSVYFTRPADEPSEKYKLFYLNISDSLNPEWKSIEEPSAAPYYTKTCSTYTTSIGKPGIYMFASASAEFDHSVKIKIKKMERPSFWVLYKDKKNQPTGHLYHTGEGEKIYTVQMAGAEKNTSMIVFAYRKGVLYYTTVAFKDLKFKKKKGYYSIKKKDFAPYEKKSDKKINRFAARFN
jgi:hypothetical protein